MNLVHLECHIKVRLMMSEGFYFQNSTAVAVTVIIRGYYHQAIHLKIIPHPSKFECNLSDDIYLWRYGLCFHVCQTMWNKPLHWHGECQCLPRSPYCASTYNKCSSPVGLRASTDFMFLFLHIFGEVEQNIFDSICSICKIMSDKFGGEICHLSSMK